MFSYPLHRTHNLSINDQPDWDAYYGDFYPPEDDLENVSLDAVDPDTY
jgi:hypothetical protein